MRRLVMDVRDMRPAWSAPDWVFDEVRSALPGGWDLTTVEAPMDGSGDGGGSSAEALRAVRGAEIYIGAGAPPELLRAGMEPPGGQLAWIHSVAAGVRGSLHEAMRSADVVFTNSAGIHAPAIAEWVVGAMLYFARGFDFAVRAQADTRWEKRPFEGEDAPVREIAGATLGIVGLGGIGRAVADRASSLGLQVIGLRRRPGDPPPGVERVLGPDGLTELLGASDYVLLAVPDTPATRGLIGTAEIEAMRASAVLLNVGRGATVQEAALAEALRTGRLRGAALDVFETEPLPAASPLWALPNALLTPHVSAVSPGFWRRQTDLILENLRRYLAGEPLRNVVDKARGY